MGGGVYFWVVPIPSEYFVCCFTLDLLHHDATLLLGWGHKSAMTQMPNGSK